MTEESKNELLQRIRKRHTNDRKWEIFNFTFYQFLLVISIIASFGSAMVAAANIAPPIFVGLLASIPGVAIVFERSFNFADRWRWHNAIATRYEAFEQTLLFEGGTIEQVSAEMGRFLSDMETRYPSHGKTEGLSMKA